MTKRHSPLLFPQGLTMPTRIYIRIRGRSIATSIATVAFHLKKCVLLSSIIDHTHYNRYLRKSQYFSHKILNSHYQTHTETKNSNRVPPNEQTKERATTPSGYRPSFWSWTS